MLDSITGNAEVNRFYIKKVENMGILRKYEYRSTWVRFADLPAENGCNCRLEYYRHNPGGKERTAPAMEWSKR